MMYQNYELSDKEETASDFEVVQGYGVPMLEWPICRKFINVE